MTYEVIVTLAAVILVTGVSRENFIKCLNTSLIFISELWGGIYSMCYFNAVVLLEKKMSEKPNLSTLNGYWNYFRVLVF